MHSWMEKGVWAMQSQTSKIVEGFKKEGISDKIQNLIHVLEMCLDCSSKSNKDQ